MQSKKNIQQLLEANGSFPKKRLGQNFLIDLNLMRMLVDSAGIKNTDVVLEVGCGTGSLTEELAERCGTVIAVEIDKTLAQIAQQQLSKNKNVTILNADILDNKSSVNTTVSGQIEEARRRTKGRFLLVGNLPYNVACPLMVNLVTGETCIDAMYVTVQKEVAERMTACPSEKAYGTLSVILNATGACKIIRKLPSSVFWPQPRVDSAMVSYIRDEQRCAAIRNKIMLSRVTNAFIQHRRKMLKAAAKFVKLPSRKIPDWPGIFAECGIEPSTRAEKLLPKDFVKLANLCAAGNDNNP